MPQHNHYIIQPNNYFIYKNTFADVHDFDATVGISYAHGKTEEQEKFLQDNTLKEGVITLPSGLQYIILKNGDGIKPGPKTMVIVHYEGSLVNGKVFDSSYKRGQPATFSVNQVISGWTEALQLMPVGSKWKLFIPSSLGYGASGAGGSIPPHATSIFDVELLSLR